MGSAIMAALAMWAGAIVIGIALPNAEPLNRILPFDRRGNLCRTLTAVSWKASDQKDFDRRWRKTAIRESRGNQQSAGRI